MVNNDMANNATVAAAAEVAVVVVD